MRITVGLLFLIVLMYLGGSAIVSARAAPAVHQWHGQGGAGPIHFSMPAGPIPGVLSRSWTFRYRVSCSGLKGHPKGAPPDLYTRPTFSYSLVGSSVGASTGTMGSDNRGNASRSMRFGNGGAYILTITARPTCKWTVTARSSH